MAKHESFLEDTPQLLIYCIGTGHFHVSCHSSHWAQAVLAQAENDTAKIGPSEDYSIKH